MKISTRWKLAALINNNLIREKTIPNFTNYIYTDGFKAIIPEGVNIIR